MDMDEEARSADHGLAVRPPPQALADPAPVAAGRDTYFVRQQHRAGGGAETHGQEDGRQRGDTRSHHAADYGRWAWWRSRKDQFSVGSTLPRPSTPCAKK